MSDDVDFRPVIRIELEGARAQIIHHLSGESVEWEVALSAAIDEAVAEYPWKETIKADATAVIRESISNYFRKGDGNKMLNQAVLDAIKDSKFKVDSEVITDLLQEGITFFDPEY